MDTLFIVIPVISFGFNIIVQILTFRGIRALSLLKSIYIGFLAGLLVLLVCHICFSNRFFQNGGYLLANFMIYSLLGYCYFNFVCLGETARRIRILRELLDAGEGLSYAELLKRYNAKDIVEVRIKRLLTNGQIVLKDGRYFIGKPVVLGMAKAVGLLKWMLFGNAKRV
jgi:hypothetical protein